MLVLSRKLGEKIIVSDNITIEVVGIAGNKVRLGIVAPPDVPILREELAAQAESWRSGERLRYREMAIAD